MVDTNPFEDVHRAIEEAVARQLEIVQELDQMEVEVTPWEAEFLDSVLKRLSAKTPLTQGQLDILHRMCNQYEIDYGDFDFGERK